MKLVRIVWDKVEIGVCRKCKYHTVCRTIGSINVNKFVVRKVDVS